MAILRQLGLKQVLHNFFSEFKRDPWTAIEGVDLGWRGFQLNVFRSDVKLRKAFLEIHRFHGIPIPSGLIVFAMVFWVICGFDSSYAQVDQFLMNLPKFIIGQISWDGLMQCFWEPYGKFMHWSAFVIYGLFFCGLSKHLRDKLDVVNSQNIAITVGFMALAIGVFEFFWMSSYRVFQSQTWILTFQWPQLRIIMQNVLTSIPVGIFTLFAINWKKVKLNIDKCTIIFLLLTLGSIFLWWHYGDYFPVQQISVQVKGYGTWISSTHFPQTVYTVDTNLLDNMAMGEQFYVQNDLIHLVNTLCKVFMTLTFYNLFKLKYRGDK